MASLLAPRSGAPLLRRGRLWWRLRAARGQPLGDRASSQRLRLAGGGRPADEVDDVKARRDACRRRRRRRALCRCALLRRRGVHALVDGGHGEHRVAPAALPALRGGAALAHALQVLAQAQRAGVLDAQRLAVDRGDAKAGGGERVAHLCHARHGRGEGRDATLALHLRRDKGGAQLGQRLAAEQRRQKDAVGAQHAPHLGQHRGEVALPVQRAGGEHQVQARVGVGQAVALVAQRRPQRQQRRRLRPARRVAVQPLAHRLQHVQRLDAARAQRRRRRRFARRRRRARRRQRRSGGSRRLGRRRARLGRLGEQRAQHGAAARAQVQRRRKGAPHVAQPLHQPPRHGVVQVVVAAACRLAAAAAAARRAQRGGAPLRSLQRRVKDARGSSRGRRAALAPQAEARQAREGRGQHSAQRV